MKLIKPSFEIMAIMESNLSSHATFKTPLHLIEVAGRTCYKTENKITKDSAEKFIKMIMDRGHESVIEHSAITVKIVCDRGVTHEIVRHRLVAYSQESTRYCNYRGGVTFVIPPWMDLPEGGLENISDQKMLSLSNADARWLRNMRSAEIAYIALLEENWTPQQARSVLPNSLKTEIVMTANFREWRHILRLRTSKAAHPQMREVMIPLLMEFQARIPVVFDDIRFEGDD